MEVRDLSIDAMSVIKQLRPVTYEWKKAIDPGMGGTQMGFIAQEIEQVIPSMVMTKNDTMKFTVASTSTVTSTPQVAAKPDSAFTTKGVKYNELFPILVKGMQQQQEIIEALQTEIATLKGGGQRGNEDGGQGQKETVNHIDLANSNQPILYQNEPNPFDGSTTIRYFVPENSGATFVVFYDMYGKEVNKLEIKEKGFGKIEANTENLAGGIYSYSILVDGKARDTKKMLKSK